MTDEYTKLIANTLKAAGALNSLVFKITEEGGKSYISPDGYSIIWYVEPVQFTFPETVAMGTVTLPSLVIEISDGESSISFRLPYEYALNFLIDAQTSLQDAYFSTMSQITDDYKNASHIHSSRSKISFKKKAVNEKPKDDDRGYV